MQFVTGEILTHNGFQKGYIGFEKGKIVDIGKGICPKKPLVNGLIIPTLVNAHTHIGDSFIRKMNIKLPQNIVELVAPQEGLKHRLLKAASKQEIIDGMTGSIDQMVKTGVSYFCDFRENGINGLMLLKQALENKDILSLAFSRPCTIQYYPDEIDMLLENSDGIGASSISDWDYSELKKVVKHTKKRKKLFGIHVSERIREDIDLVLDLKPDFLVHMIYATESDFSRVKDNEIPVIICPRSNKFFGLKPDINLMKKIGIEILLGTDNAMLNAPIILDEIKYLKSLYKNYSLQELLYMITYRARKALNLDSNILGLDSKAEFVVLNRKTLTPVYI